MTQRDGRIDCPEAVVERFVVDYDCGKIVPRYIASIRNPLLPLLLR